ncbi:MAG: xanthine dehydrogenase family protein molybdopterin-binding subunit [Ktedonobacteraceae bacterium]
MELELRVNGVVESLDVAAGESLLTLLRRNGYTSVKQGCETGECGACTVWVDGLPKPSCVMLAAQAGGCTLTTIEGLSTASTLHPVQQAFVDMGAVQCGFCLPGMLLSASALLNRTLDPPEDEVRDALSGNLCRCMGYEKPVQAVLRAAAIMRGEVPAEYGSANGNELGSTSGRQRAIATNGVNNTTGKQRAAQSTTLFMGLSNMSLSVVGKSVRAVDAIKLVTGRSTFTDDITIKGMLYGKVLTSPHPHAVIRHIDVSAARAIPGVHAVLTYEDVQRVPYASGSPSGPQDRYSLDYIVRYVGDRVAAVAAETPELAQEALERILVEYDVLPALLDPRQTLEANAVRIHPESESRNIYAAERNIAARTRIEGGDIDRSFADADMVIEGEYLTTMTRQAALETRIVLTYFDEDDYLVVRSNAYAPHLVRRTVAAVLDLPPRRVRVEQPTIGSASGTQQCIVLEDICALLTQATKRPVRLAYSRAEEFRDSHAYPQHIVRMKTGVKRNGTILANQMVVLASTGAYGAYSPTNSDVFRLYPCAHTRFVTEILYTNHPPASNTPAADAESFALESHIDEIARRLGMDAIALRRKNWSKTGTVNASESGIEGSSVSECMKLVETKLQWSGKRGHMWNSRLHRGVGIALTHYDNTLSDVESSGALIKLNDDGSFDIFVNVADSTIKTMLAQIAAEVLNVSIEDILLHTSGTESTPFATTTNAASTLYNAGAALRRAAEQVRRQVLVVAGRLLSVMPETLTIQDGTIIPSPLNGQTLTIAQIASQLLSSEGKQIIASASWKETKPPTAFAVQGAEVEVDTETGAMRVIKLVTALDAGFVIHPSLAEGQMQGSVAQGLGVATSEDVVYDQYGQLLTATLSDYHIYNAAEMPELQTYFIYSETNASRVFGAKSVVEVARNGVAPAIANAVADALGFRIHQLPLTPEHILRALYMQNSKR